MNELINTKTADLDSPLLKRVIGCLGFLETLLLFGPPPICQESLSLKAVISLAPILWMQEGSKSQRRLKGKGSGGIHPSPPSEPQEHAAVVRQNCLFVF